eukprot:SM000015S01251  [mRNA]  locus=s15:799711:801122:+ [translate_table: standard]
MEHRDLHRQLNGYFGESRLRSRESLDLVAEVGELGRVDGAVAVGVERRQELRRGSADVCASLAQVRHHGLHLVEPDAPVAVPVKHVPHVVIDEAAAPAPQTVAGGGSKHHLLEARAGDTCGSLHSRLEVGHLAGVLEAALVSAVRSRAAVRRERFHRGGADLDLHGRQRAPHAVGPHGEVQRAVAVALGRRDVVLGAAGDLVPERARELGGAVARRLAAVAAAAAGEGLDDDAEAEGLQQQQQQQEEEQQQQAVSNHVQGQPLARPQPQLPFETSQQLHALPAWLLSSLQAQQQQQAQPPSAPEPALLSAYASGLGGQGSNVAGQPAPHEKHGQMGESSSADDKDGPKYLAEMVMGLLNPSQPSLLTPIMGARMGTPTEVEPPQAGPAEHQLWPY